ncbi:MAG: hypothetical protein QOJ66_2119 [Ilumatobacteraceae bacterium]
MAQSAILRLPGDGAGDQGSGFVLKIRQIMPMKWTWMPRTLNRPGPHRCSTSYRRPSLCSSRLLLSSRRLRPSRVPRPSRLLRLSRLLRPSCTALAPRFCPRHRKHTSPTPCRCPLRPSRTSTQNITDQISSEPGQHACSLPPVGLAAQWGTRLPQLRCRGRIATSRPTTGVTHSTRFTGYFR